MQKRTLPIPTDVQTIIFYLGTLPNPCLAMLSSEEEKQAAAARQADYERVNAVHGDFVGAVRDGIRDDGLPLIKGEALYTGENADQLVALGFRFLDAYQIEKIKQGKKKKQVVAIFSKVGEPTARATDEVQAAVRMHLTFNWFQTFVWHNPLREVPNMTINAWGVLEEGVPGNLELVASNVVANQPV